MIREATPTEDRRQRRRARRTAEILDHAVDVVITDGLSALTMPRLAKECDAAVGALYRYFPSKDAVIAALQVRAVQRLSAFLGELAVDEPPLVRITAIATAWEGFRMAEPAMHALVDRSLSDPDVVLSDADAMQVDAAVRDALAPLVDALTEAAASGGLADGDPELRAYAVWAAVHGVGHFRKRDRIVPERLRSALVARELIGGLLRGWGADPDALDAALAGDRSGRERSSM